jgi:GxxExxY protein
MVKECDPELIDRVLTAATAVHRELGPGLFESVYEQALAVELRAACVDVVTQIALPVTYRGVDLGLGYRIDVLVPEKLILEIKSVRHLEPVHVNQVLTYLRCSQIRTGFILNFNSRLMKDGIKRVTLFSQPENPRVPRGNSLL